jgi:hypothetical protein
VVESATRALKNLGLGLTMKKLFAATVSVAALYGASALAADMPKAYTKAPVYKAAAPGYNWTGWYGGVDFGGWVYF